MAQGPPATSVREPGQVRKEAALSGSRRAPGGFQCRSRPHREGARDVVSKEGARSIWHPAHGGTDMKRLTMFLAVAMTAVAGAATTDTYTQGNATGAPKKG